MREYKLKYGCNPDQAQARIFMRNGKELPIEILNGRPGYINFLDALNSWQLVKELRKNLKLPAAASFKHVSPAGAALGLPLNDNEKKLFFVDEKLDINSSPLACAYARARGTDRLSSFGDWIALSDTCDEVTANYIKREVSDGVIAPDYTPEALEILKSKRKGNYAVVKIDADYEPELIETRDVFGISFEQSRSTAPVIEPEKFNTPVTLKKDFPDEAKRDLVLALITLKYTQSNSVCVAYNGQTLGVGAGQQSRLHCVKLACDKADLRILREHPKILNLEFDSSLGRPERDNAINLCLTERDIISPDERKEFLANYKGVSLGSDAFFPFPDNIERAAKSGVTYIAQPGGSIRDDLVIKACDEKNIAMVMTGHRLFHH
ncbi:MAG: phosphoribosylaminoimidazolecarboxamide formyltransferase [Synergistales bacterium]|nr:phosphoribosylaminoimidazolecarboxamide formyltransferase [Synergistales bacterium]MDY6401072.1 phosphoribosylaminoimidazolecarboxamide formyltransferase [Synergistales bacterium]MDY6404665.1 phosphoribosylaminoimidazolecarboxamide formyltransferase [Synergistales bacterium]MDY6410919.1 phosphoribosylaminoimidazolecarboxamide formyltransferase [Synergistales bacterium]MDY6415110.1 phosphoribosylaminoimidazolecarboxamide formyltransferase [Synergistales bacterium]